MKNMVRLAAVVISSFSVFAAGSARAQLVPIPGIDNTGFGTTSAEFLLLGAGARAAALGGGFAAIADDIEALYWNPGGVALIENGGFSVSSYNYIAGTQYTWFGLVFPMGGGERVLGFHGATFGFSNQPIYTAAEPEGDGSTYSVAESYLGFTYSQNFSDRFSAGFTGKWINDILGRTTASAFAMDFGTNFHAMIGDRPIRAAFTIQNLGTTLRHTGPGLDVDVTRDPAPGVADRPQDPQLARLETKAWGLPTMFRVGVAYDIIATQSARVTILSEFVQPSNSNATGGGGLEWALLNISNSGFGVVARGSYTHQPDNDFVVDAAAVGFTTGLSSQENSDGVAFGGGITYSRAPFMIAIDYAFRDLGILGSTNFYSATIHW